jgi:hypothetical protein
VHIQTHALTGWCLGNLVPGLTPPQRLCCLLAATLPDLDGLGWFISDDAYWDYHHVLGHNLPFGLLLTTTLLTFSYRRDGRSLLILFPLYLALFHSHLLMDYYGSGPDWPIYYGWPFSHAKLLNPHAWPLFSWQNILTFFLLLTWTLIIAAKLKRTPLEALMPELDAKLVRLLRPSFKHNEPRGFPVITVSSQDQSDT